MKSEKEIKQKQEDLETENVGEPYVNYDKSASFYAGVEQALAWVLDDEKYFSMRGKDNFFEDSI